jgi:hypothetical protein
MEGMTRLQNRFGLFHFPKRCFGLLLLIVGLCVYLDPRAFAEEASDITSEPHHHLLLQNNQVRVFEVTLHPSEKMLVRHDHNFLTITLQDCEMVMWAEGQSEVQNFRFNQGDVRFAFAGPARGTRNDHGAEYRNITVEFLNPKVTTFGYQPSIGGWQYGSSSINPPVDPHKKFKTTLHLGDADASDVQLLQGDLLAPPEKKGTDELLVPTTDVDLKGPSDLHVRKANGEVVWLGDGRKNNLMNAVPEPARFVVVEFLPGQN